MEMHLVELAVAERLFVLVAVPLLLWIGYRLFELGVTGKMTIAGTLKNGFRYDPPREPPPPGRIPPKPDRLLAPVSRDRS